jgi:hypothetical protein
MNSSADNPAANVLGAGLDELKVTNAVEKSGYPLQTVVREILEEDFYSENEWCYVDRDSKDLRAIDIRAHRRLHDWGDGEQPRVRPNLELLVECKQSQLPYVFFLCNGGATCSLELAGLRSPDVTLTTDDDLSTYNFSPLGVLDLDDDPFHRVPAYSSSFAKCVRKGAELELSGTEAYSGLILPLIKAVQHLRAAEHPVPTAWYFDARLVLAVGVLDAPMIAATVKSGATTLTLVPWVRVSRHEYLEGVDKWHRERVWHVDVVHKEFLSVFLKTHVLPFAGRFCERVLRHTHELATGEGFASHLGKDWSSPMEPRLRPRPPHRESQVSRIKLLARDLLKLIRGPQS